MIVDELVTILGLDVDSKASANASKFEKMLGGITSVAKQAGAAVLAISGASIALNQVTTEFDNQAKAINFSTDSLKAWQGVLDGTEYSVDNIADLIDEMNLKLGESSGLGEQMTPVKEALQILGLSFEDIINLSPEEQFETITQATKDMANASEAAAAADILMGGEASRIIGVLRNQEGSIRDLLDAQRQYNFLTEDGIKGAKESSKEFGILRRVVTSLGQDIAGKAGAGIAVATAALTDFIVVNNELISLGIGQLIDGISLGFEIFGDSVSYAWDTVTQFIPELGFLGENLDFVQVVGVAVAGVLGVLTAAAIAAAAPFVVMAAKIAAVVLIVEDLYSWLNGGDSVFKGWYESAVDWVGSMVDYILEAFNPVFELFDSVGNFWNNTLGFGDSGNVNAPVQTQMPAQVMQGATSNNSTTINQTINGAGDARAVGDRVMAGMYGAGYTATTSNYSWNRYGG